MVQKSGQGVEVGSWNPIIYRVWWPSKRWLFGISETVGILKFHGLWNNPHVSGLCTISPPPPKKKAKKRTNQRKITVFGALFLLFQTRVAVVVVVLATPRWRITTWWRLKRWPFGAMRRLELLKHQKKDPVGVGVYLRMEHPWKIAYYIYIYNPPMAGELGVFSSDVSAFFLSESELMSIDDIPAMIQLIWVIGAMDGLRSFRKKPLTIPINWEARCSGSNRMSCWKLG